MDSPSPRSKERQLMKEQFMENRAAIPDANYPRGTVSWWSTLLEVVRRANSSMLFLNGRYPDHDKEHMYLHSSP